MTIAGLAMVLNVTAASVSAAGAARDGVSGNFAGAAFFAGFVLLNTASAIIISWITKKS